MFTVLKEKLLSGKDSKSNNRDPFNGADDGPDECGRELMETELSHELAVAFDTYSKVGRNRDPAQFPNYGLE